LADAINSLAAAEQDIIDQSLLNLNSRRKTKAEDFVDLTISTVLHSSDAPDEDLTSLTRDVSTTTPVSAVSISFPTTTKRKASSLSSTSPLPPMKDSNEDRVSNIQLQGVDETSSSGSL
jgi:hypothetical protein